MAAMRHTFSAAALLLAIVALPACGRSGAHAQDAAAAPDPAPFTPRGPTLSRGPYLQQLSSSSVILRWRTAQPCKGRVKFHMVSDQPVVENFEKEEAPTMEHQVLIKNLLPATAYDYQVLGNNVPLANVFGKAEGRFKTAPRVGEDAPVRFFAVGDSGTADKNAKAVYDAFLAFSKDKPADLWLMLGDNAYSRGTEAQYQKAVFETYPGLLRACCLWPTIGNHDARSASSVKQSGPYYDAFALPTKGECGGVPSGTEAYYAFDHGPVHFICLDSEDSPRTADGAQAKWLKADLEANASPWRIVFFHTPPYTKGSHDSDEAKDSGGRLKDMREVFLPILEEAGVDLVLCGHSHSYERSFLLRGHYGQSMTLTKDMILDGGSGNPADGKAYDKKVHPKGDVFIVAGSSGKIGGGPLNHPAMRCSLNALGSLVVDVKGKRLEAQFLNEKGETKDRFVMEK